MYIDLRHIHHIHDVYMFSTYMFWELHFFQSAERYNSAVLDTEIITAYIHCHLPFLHVMLCTLTLYTFYCTP